LIDPPTFDPPEQTRPLLLATKAAPSLQAIVASIDPTDQENFSAEVLSEDTGVDVSFRLLVDYGRPNVLNDPYAFTADFDSLPAGTLATGPRPTPQFTWALSIFAADPGCHTVTLFASHVFDDQGSCPADLADSSQLTWIVEVCAPGGVCPTTCNLPQAGCVDFVCEQPTVACPALSGGGGAGGGP
jgi:hypothetical protein